MKINCKTNFLIGVVIFAILLVGSFTIRQFAQNRKIQTQEGEASIVEVGVMSDSQKKHSKLYSQTKRNKDLLSGKGDVRIVFTESWKESITEEQMFSTQEMYLQRTICKPEIIAIAKVESKSSQLTENHQFVFTDYDLNVSKVLKNNSVSNIGVPQSINLTIPGGAVKVRNRLINIVFNDSKPLNVGEEYLLFLNYNKDIETFELTNPEGVFSILGNEIKHFNSTSGSYQYEEKDANTFINEITTATQGCYKED